MRYAARAQTPRRQLLPLALLALGTAPIGLFSSHYAGDALVGLLAAALLFVTCAPLAIRLG